MTFTELFASNLDWNSETELTIYIVSGDTIDFKLGKAIDLVLKYGGYKVTTFSSTAVSIRIQPKRETHSPVTGKIATYSLTMAS